MKDIPLKTNDLNVFSINPKTVIKLSFKTKTENFNELYIGEIKIWLQYDNENILLKEADIFNDSFEKNKGKGTLLFFNLNQADIYKDLIISTTLFNGEGFIYMTRFEHINSNSIKLNYKNKDYSYGINSNKAIEITKDDIKFFEKK